MILSSDAIKQHIDIVELISETVALTLKGKDYWGLCPFHDEQTPSFSVSPEKGFFYCFGCHTKGDVYDYVMQYYQVDFKTAKNMLADRAGLPHQKLTREEFRNFRVDQERRRREKEILDKLHAVIDDEYDRLIDIEKTCYLIQETITAENDLDSPAVVWALKTKDLVSFYLDELHKATPIEAIQIVYGTRGWNNWLR